jgi:NAD/NADP transhydrogenase alpha subunit
MNDDELHDQIARLELRIEDLGQAAEKCRKFAYASKLAIVVGVVWLGCIVVGAIRPTAVDLIGAITAIIGGTVVFGSNTSTARQTAADMDAAQAQRAELIGRIDLRLVSD